MRPHRRPTQSPTGPAQMAPKKFCCISPGNVLPCIPLWQTLTPADRIDTTRDWLLVVNSFWPAALSVPNVSSQPSIVWIPLGTSAVSPIVRLLCWTNLLDCPRVVAKEEACESCESDQEESQWPSRAAEASVFGRRRSTSHNVCLVSGVEVAGQKDCSGQVNKGRGMIYDGEKWRPLCLFLYLSSRFSNQAGPFWGSQIKHTKRELNCGAEGTPNKVLSAPQGFTHCPKPLGRLAVE